LICHNIIPSVSKLEVKRYVCMGPIGRDEDRGYADALSPCRRVGSKESLRRMLFEYKLHADQELFKEAYDVFDGPY
jgi:hypothetical protein